MVSLLSIRLVEIRLIVVVLLLSLQLTPLYIVLLTLLKPLYNFFPLFDCSPLLVQVSFPQFSDCSLLMLILLKLCLSKLFCVCGIMGKEEQLLVIMLFALERSFDSR
jgi:hypothetical protein